MALPITPPYTFANATTTQNLSYLDADFATVYNAVNGIGNGTVALANVNITGGTVNAAFNSTTIAYGTSNVSVTSSNGPVVIFTNGSEAMRIDSSGNLLVGATFSVNGGSVISVAAGTVSSIITAATTSTNMIVFRNGNGNVGSVTTIGTATLYNTGSDYRLKENVAPITTALTVIAALKPVTYNWVSDKSKGEGFIAHELQEIIPAAVTGEKDAVNEKGEPVYQGVDYSKIVVHLVAALQEAVAKIDALETRIATLETK